MEVKVRTVDKPRHEVFQHLVSVLVEKGIEFKTADKGEKEVVGQWYSDPLLMTMLSAKGYMETKTPLMIRLYIILKSQKEGKTEIFVNIQGKIQIEKVVSVKHSIYSDQRDVNLEISENKIKIEEYTYTVPPQYYDIFFDTLGNALKVDFPHMATDLPVVPPDVLKVKSMNEIRKERRRDSE